MSIDVEGLKNRINCRDVVERDLGKPHLRAGRYSVYKCPLHNETKGFSLVIYDDRWHCYGKCDRGGDVIAWVQDYHRLSFPEACEWLSPGSTTPVAPVPHRETAHKAQPMRQVRHATSAAKDAAASMPNEASCIPDADWQAAARKIAQQAMDTLWGQEGKRAWRYLQEERGLNEDTIIQAGLGYIPGNYREWRTIEGLHVPCGITMPWTADQTLWGIKVRRAAGEQRYQQVNGGNIKGSLYLADDIQPGLPVLLVEGEFDALIAQQAGRGLISATALGSAANKHIAARWYMKLIAAPNLLICMDDDGAGQAAEAHLRQLSQAAHCVHVPQGKDINEFYLLAGHDAVRAWIASLVG